MNESLLLLAGETPSVMYHYTSADVFHRIVTGRRLFASNALFLNDTTELKHGIALFRERTALRNDGPKIKRFFDYATEILSWSVDPHDQRGFDVYVACFSADRDVVPLWRGYGADGAGYALGFDFDETLRATQHPAFRVIYNRKDQEAVLDVTIDGCVEALKRSLKEYPDDEDAVAHNLGTTMASFLMQLLAFFKHDSFEYEAEWRIASFVLRASEASTAQFRVGRGIVVPYVELVLGTTSRAVPLREVRCGPTAAREVALNAAKVFVTRVGLKCEVTQSTLPVRFL